MYALFIFAIFSCSTSTIWTATPFKDCGSEAGTIQSFVVSNCDAAPCKLIKGQTYSMNLTFAAKAPSQTGTVVIHGIIGGVPVPFPLPDPDMCKLNVKCPVAANDNNTASLSLPILSTYPSISLYIKLEIKSDQNQDYACLQFPATIASGLNGKRKPFGWKRGKLFDLVD